MNKYIKAVFNPGDRHISVSERLSQWDVGLILQITGLTLPETTEVHFANSGDMDALRVIAKTKDGVTEATIPNEILQSSGTAYAYVYVTDKESSRTEYKINLYINRREKPQDYAPENQPDPFGKMLEEIIKVKDSVSADRTIVESVKTEVEQISSRIPATVEKGVQTINVAKKDAVSVVKKAGEDTETNITQTIIAEGRKQIEAIQKEGTTQTGNVTKEGEKQVQAVQQAAQEIVADREQIKTNKDSITQLKGAKADVIVDSASGENITLTDSVKSPFRGLRIFGKSTQDGTPSPESPVPIVNVGVKGMIEVEVAGKNLFDINSYTSNNGCEIIRNTIVLDKHLSTIDYNLILEKGTYNLSFKRVNYSGIILKKGEESLMANGSHTNYSKSFALQEDATVNMHFECGQNHNQEQRLCYDIQLEKGSVATSYETYRTPQTLTIHTPNGLLGIKVDSGGNYTDENGQQWVCDEIDLERGKYVQRIWEKIFDGHEEWFAYTTSPYDGFFVRCLPELMQKREGLCTFTQVLTYSHIAESMWIGSNNDYIYYIKNPLYNVDLADKGLANWKAHLAKKPMKVMTYLAKPIERDLTPEEIATYKALHTNYPTTVINNDENAGMEISYVADTKNYIDNKFRQLSKATCNLQAQNYALIEGLTSAMPQEDNP